MTEKPQPIQDFLLKAVSSHPSDLIKHTAKHFNLSVQAIQKHAAKLVHQGKLTKKGNTRAAVYALPTEQVKTFALNSANAGGWVVSSGNWYFAVDSNLSEQAIFDSTLKARLAGAPENIQEIVEYGFTEMVNNVKDHAEAKKLNIEYFIRDDVLSIFIQDDGVGIFRKIKEKLNLSTLREAVLDLSKGKLTTDHTKHTGEGIFFSSRVFDTYFLKANGLLYGRLNGVDEDWLVGEEKNATEGTMVNMTISLKSLRSLDQVFRQFTSPEDFSFSKTHVAVELGMNEGETYVSRSQAKRILSGLEKFRFIVLNFKRVKTVGQGFIDEVFRVFRAAHPEIQIDHINANESVEFMIKRGLGK